MNLGPSLLGALVGAAVGVGVQLGVEVFMGHEAIWIAIVIGTLAGLGARIMAGEGRRNTSFIRAGLVALLALGAMIGGSYASSSLTRSNLMADIEDATRRKPVLDDPAPADDDTPDDENEDEPATAEDPTNDEPTGDDATSDGASSEDSDGGDAEEGEATESEGDPADDAGAEGEADDDTTDTVEPAVEDPEAAADDGTGEDGAEEPADVPKPMPLDASQYVRSPSDQEVNDPAALPTSPFQFVLITIGTLIAYELARGGSKK